MSNFNQYAFIRLLYHWQHCLLKIKKIDIDRALSIDLRIEYLEDFSNEWLFIAITLLVAVIPELNEKTLA